MKTALLAAVFVVIAASWQPVFAAPAETGGSWHEGQCASSLDRHCNSHFTVERDLPPGTADADFALVRVRWHHHHHECTCGLSKSGHHSARQQLATIPVSASRPRRLAIPHITPRTAINRPRRQ